MRFNPGCGCCACQIKNCGGFDTPVAGCVAVSTCCHLLCGTWTVADQGGDEWLKTPVGACCGGAFDSWFLTWDSGSSLWELMYCSSAYCIYRGTFDSSRVAKTLSRTTPATQQACYDFPATITINPVGSNDWEFTI